MTWKPRVCCRGEFDCSRHRTRISGPSITKTSAALSRTARTTRVPSRELARVPRKARHNNAYYDPLLGVLIGEGLAVRSSS